MPYFCTFITPTIGRDTLTRTIQSVINQTCADWNMHVVGDGLGSDWKPPWLHQRILFSNLSQKHGTSNHGGMCRNHALSTAVGQWFAFVDDDDRLDEHYLEWLREESINRDVVVFRMKYPDESVLPSGDALALGNVGISFAVRSEFQRASNVWFIPSETEDWGFLSSLLSSGARLKMSSRIAYYVRH